MESFHSLTELWTSPSRRYCLIRELPIANTMTGQQEVQSLRDFRGALLGRFSNAAAVALWRTASLSVGPIMTRIKPSRLALGRAAEESQLPSGQQTGDWGLGSQMLLDVRQLAGDSVLLE